MSYDIEDHITSKYAIKRRIGKGAYGIVWKSVDRKSGEIVALKKIFDAFTNPTDAQRTYREIMFLQEFSSHENVIQLLDVIRARNDQDIYLVFEFMDTDLHAVIKAKILQPVHIQYIMYQLFKVITYLHSGNCIHRDLKPSNILLNSECFIKLADFGLARSLVDLPKDADSNFNPAMTDYVATRWYRAPEILLGSVKYTKGVDLWSLGCILAEMVIGKALFPGTSTMNQIDKILAVVPTPNKADVESIKSPYAQSVLDRLLKRRRISLTDCLPGATKDCLDLVGKLLPFNPDKRLSAQQALSHPYVLRFHNPAEEPRLSYNVVPCLDDNTQLSIEDYRDKLYESIVQKRQDLIVARQKASEAAEVVEDVELKEEFTDSPSARERTDEPLATVSDTDIVRVKQSPKAERLKTSAQKTPYSPQHVHQPRLRKAPMARQGSAPLQRQGSAPLQRQGSAPLQQGQRPSFGGTQRQDTVKSTFSKSARPPTVMKGQAGRTQSRRAPQAPNNDDHQLMITSARIIPGARPTSSKYKKVSRGGPSRFASGSYTQSHGVISRTNLTHLKENKW